MSATHPVQVDDDAVANVLGGAPGQPESTHEEVAAEEINEAPKGNPEAYLRWTILGSAIVAAKFFPNWNVPQDVQLEFAQATAEILAEHFPNGTGVAEKTGPWGKLIVAAASWARCGFDVEKFEMKPLRAPEEETPTQKPTADDAELSAAPTQTAAQSSGTFSTSAG